MTTVTVVDEPENPLERAPLVEGRNNFATITEQIARVAEQKTPRGWYLLFGISAAALLNLGAVIAYLLYTGVGIWGNNHPVAWAMAERSRSRTRSGEHRRRLGLRLPAGSPNCWPRRSARPTN